MSHVPASGNVRGFIRPSGADEHDISDGSDATGGEDRLPKRLAAKPDRVLGHQAHPRDPDGEECSGDLGGVGEGSDLEPGALAARHGF